MSATIRIPTQLRSLSGGIAVVTVKADTVGTALKELDVAHPGFAERILDESGGVRRFVNVFVGDEDIRFLQGSDTPVASQQISIVPAVAGG